MEVRRHGYVGWHGELAEFQWCKDFERARRVIDAAIKHGATPESMAEPIEEFAMELHAYCEAIERLKETKENKTQNP